MVSTEAHCKGRLNKSKQPVPQVETPTFLRLTLDTRLTWKPHLEAVEAKATRKLSIMKKLAGTTWGGREEGVVGRGREGGKGRGKGELRPTETGLHRDCKTSR